MQAESRSKRMMNFMGRMKDNVANKVSKDSKGNPDTNSSDNTKNQIKA